MPLVELENYYNSLQDKKSEVRRRSLWILAVAGAVALVGYVLNSNYSIYLYVPASFGGLIWLLTFGSPLQRTEMVFEKVYKAMELAGRQDNRATRRKLRRLLKSVLSLPAGTESALLTEGVEEHKKMDILIKRRLLPAAHAGKVKETTVEALAQLLRAPTFTAVKEFNEQLTVGYDDVNETTLWSRLSEFRRGSVGRFVVPMAGALAIGFPIALGVANLIVVGVFHSDFVKYASAPTFGAAIFSFGAGLTLLLYRQFRQTRK